MEIDITRFVTEADPYEFSASIAERGDNAGPETWRNAVAEGESSPLLTTPEQLDALRAYMKGFGAWDDEEIAAWVKKEGIERSPQEIEEWNKTVSSNNYADKPDKKGWLEGENKRLGLDKDGTLFDMLDADDKASFKK